MSTRKKSKIFFTTLRPDEKTKKNEKFVVRNNLKKNITIENKNDDGEEFNDDNFTINIESDDNFPKKIELNQNNENIEKENKNKKKINKNNTINKCKFNTIIF